MRQVVKNKIAEFHCLLVEKKYLDSSFLEVCTVHQMRETL